MTDKARLLKIKAQLKKRQPTFLRQDSQKFKGTAAKPKWRRPKGLHSKMRDNRRGYRMTLRQGYRTPVAVRGMDKHGLYPTLITTLAQLSTLDPKTHSVIIAGSLGGKKRLAILEAAKAKSFRISNLPADAHERILAKRKAAVDEKKAREEKKSARAKEAEAKAAKKTAKKADAAADGETKADAPVIEEHAHKHKPKADEKPVKKEKEQKTEQKE